MRTVMAHTEPPDTFGLEDQFQHALTRSDGAAARARADAVLRRFGTGVAAAWNPDSASNDVWVAGTVCLRMARQAGTDDLRDEAHLAALVPADIGYPFVLATGVEDGHEWMVCHRLPGTNLWDAWPVLTHPQRLRAIEDLWHRHLALQRTEITSLRPRHRVPPRRYALEREKALHQLQVLVEARVVDDAWAPQVWDLVTQGLAAAGAVPWRLVHGDPAFSNVQCAEGRVIGLLDLEAAGCGPCDLDLDPLLRMLADPLDDPGVPGPYGLPTAASFVGAFAHLVTVAAPSIQRPGAAERLRGYAVLFRLAVLATARERGVPVPVLRGWTRDLHALVHQQSYLDRIWS
jgi:scyllo-inosamine 4-kinase